MGESFVALSDDLNAVHFNPAGLGYIIQPEFQATYSMWLAEMYYGFAGYLHPSRAGTFALSGIYLSGPSITRIENGNIKDTFSPYSYSANFSYGNKISKNIAIGFNLKNVQESLDTDYNANVFFGDAGVLYRTINEKFSFGYSVKNFGQEFKFSGSKIKEKPPIEHSAGIGFKFSMPSQYSDINISISATKPEYGNTSYEIGIEHWGARTLALRFGYRYPVDEKIRKTMDSLSYWRAGLGLNIKGIGIDYAYQPVSSVGDTHRFSFILRFIGWKMKPKEVKASLKVDPQFFSPNNDGIKDTTFFIPEVTEIEKIQSWDIKIKLLPNIIVHSFGSKEQEEILPKIITWDGKKLTGEYISEGTYNVIFEAKGSGKIAKSDPVPLTVDLTPPEIKLSVSTDTFSPDGDLNFDETTFYFVIKDSNTIDRWQLNIANAKNKIVKTYKSTETTELSTSTVEKEIVWDGKDDVYGEVVPNGSYIVTLTAFDIAGNKNSTSTIANVYVPPKTKTTEIKDILKDIEITEEERGLRITLSSDMLFDKNDEIKESSKIKLDKVIELSQIYPENKILIEGHTDSVGSREKNINISSKRAWNVYSYLVKNGINPARLSVKGCGPDFPIAPNTTRKGRIKNRRIEIILLKN